VASQRNRSAQRDLRVLFDAGTVAGLTDGQLLERFAARHGEISELAFATLVERHGPMVLRVCRAILRHEHEAEDAFQATFLILVRKAGSLWVRDSLGPWLYRVSYRVAVRARIISGRRKAAERQAAEAASDRFGGGGSNGPGPALYKEIDQLPDRYRIPVVLCDLEGRTYEEAARHVGCPVGTLKSRLARGRQRLRERLARRGLIPEGVLGTVLFSDAAPATVPSALAELTAQAAIHFVTGASLTVGAVSMSATMLAQAILRGMIMTKLRWIGTILAAVSLATGAGLLTFRASGSQDQVLPRRQPSQPEGGVGSAAGPIRSWADLLSAESRVGQKAYEQALVSYRDGKVDLEKVHLWSQRVMQAQIATLTSSYVTDPKSRAVCVAAAKAHRDRMKRLEELVRARVEKGEDLPLSGSTAEYYHLEAEGLVLEYDRDADSNNR
jgi:DNA-directed RNA polymerase specialized sigma24 family protein